jgi:hypothetical protein
MVFTDEKAAAGASSHSAVAGVEAEVAHHAGEQRAVHSLGAATAVLVGLDLDQRRLGPAGEAGIAKLCGSPSLRWYTDRAVRYSPSESVVKVLIAIRPLLSGQWKYAPPGPSSGRAPHRQPADVAGPQRTGGGVPSTVAASAGSHAQVVQECRTTARAKRTEVACGSSAQRTSSQSRTNSPSARSQRAVGG